jgi:hypothetical protein
MLAPLCPRPTPPKSGQGICCSIFCLQSRVVGVVLAHALGWACLEARSLFPLSFRSATCIACIDSESPAPRSTQISKMDMFFKFLCVISYGAGCFGSCWVGRVSKAVLLFLVLFRPATSTVCIDFESRAPHSGQTSWQCVFCNFSCVISCGAGGLGSGLGSGATRILGRCFWCCFALLLPRPYLDFECPAPRSAQTS